MAEGFVSVHDLIQLESVGDKPFWIDLSRLHRLEQHRCRYRVEKPCGDGNVSVPELFQMQIGLHAMNADIGDDSARSDDFLAGKETGGNTHCLDCRVDTSSARHLQD